ncbi:MAG TPA: hypothetical protein VF627_15930 [Abditibacterium sp.]|jgi:hypothetical protein
MPQITDSHHCPICQTPKPEDKRYPDYVCNLCNSQIEDEVGRALSITNKDAWDGLVITYAETGEERESRECYVQGVRCWASQAHLGGVVIQPFDEPKNGVQQTVEDARKAAWERIANRIGRKS